MNAAAVTQAAQSAANTATTPEDVVQHAMAVLFATLGDRAAHLMPGALALGQTQFLVAGGFFVTPDRQHQMLVGNTGFPPEQKRLLIPIDGGHPGRVIATGQPILLTDTRSHGSFRQYLKTARMGSAIYAPLIWEDAAQGLIIMAGLAAGTMSAADLAVLEALAPAVTHNWLRLGGPDWLAREYHSLPSPISPSPRTAPGPD